MIFSGWVAATSSMSMPPACDAMTTWVPRPRSSVIDRYSSAAIGEASSTSTLRTLMPSGGVCGVLSIMPRICFAAASAAAGSSASFTPPALPRPPACTCAFTTTCPPSLAAMALAWAGVSATSPLGTGTPNSRRIALPWYSWIFTAGLAGDLPHDPHDGIVVLGDDPLLERDQGIVGDVDVLGADLGAALGDVAEAEPGLGLDQLEAVVGVERVHLELGEAHEIARPREGRLVLRVVADDVADVLAEEALDALAELLAALDVLLLHAPGAVRLLRPAA